MDVSTNTWSTLNKLTPRIITCSTKSLVQLEKLGDGGCQILQFFKKISKNYQDFLKWGRRLVFKSYLKLLEGFSPPKLQFYPHTTPNPSRIPTIFPTIRHKRVTINTKMPACKFKVHRFTFSFSRFRDLLLFSFKTANKLKWQCWSHAALAR